MTQHPPSSRARSARTYSVREVAEILGVSKSTAYECVRSGQLPAVKLRSRILVPIEAVEAFLAQAGPLEFQNASVSIALRLPTSVLPS